MIVSLGLFISTMSFSAPLLQTCGGGSAGIICSAPSLFDDTVSSTEVFSILKAEGCSLTEEKLSLLNSAQGVDTYRCSDGNLAGLSFLIFYTTSPDDVINIIIY